MIIVDVALKSPAVRVTYRNIGAHGSHEWSSAVAADTDGNFYVAGQTNGEVFDLPTGSGGDIWVAKLDGRQGTVMWGYQASAITYLPLIKRRMVFCAVLSSSSRLVFRLL